MSDTPLERLRSRQAALGAPLCLGIDPHPDALPDDLTRDAAGIERFARGVLEAAAEFASAVKINVAFFEAFGSAGWAALERIRGDIPGEHVLILDAKRGDMGSTAERQATALFGRLDADGVTLSPYLGEDAIQPFADYPDRLIYVLARTSNPDAGRLQDLPVRTDGAERPLARRGCSLGREPLAGRTGGPGGRRHRARRARAAAPNACRSQPSWCPAWGRRVATWLRRCAPVTGVGRQAW